MKKLRHEGRIPVVPQLFYGKRGRCREVTSRPSHLRIVLHAVAFPANGEGAELARRKQTLAASAA